VRVAIALLAASIVSVMLPVDEFGMFRIARILGYVGGQGANRQGLVLSPGRRPAAPGPL